MAEAKGPWTAYRPKHLPNKSVSLTKLAKDSLAAAAGRCETSESNIVEHLIRMHAGELSAEAFERQPDPAEV